MGAATEKHPVTPGPLAPARELYGIMLLDRAMLGEALKSAGPIARFIAGLSNHNAALGEI
jgi:hypothetical protein